MIPAAHLDADCWARAEAIRADVPSLEHVLVIGAQGSLPEGFGALDPLLEAACETRLDFAPTTDPDAASALFHTGGTTGRPKLVPLSHGNQIHAAFGFGQVFGYCETDCVLNGFPFFHVGGTMTVGLAVLAAGGHMVIPSPYALRPREVVQNYWRLAEAFGTTVVSGVPTSIAALSATYPQDLRLDALRMAVTGGAGLPESVAEAFERKLGVRLYETYGMTETAAAIAFTPRHGDPVRGSVGLRAPFSQTRVIQSRAPDTPCPAGVSGEVQLRGPQVFAGYIDPAHNSGILGADGWLSTGDIGYLTADERLVLTGRAKDLIVRSGHNIDPTAIEEVANRHPDVETSAAVGMPDQYAGEVPALFVVAAQGRAVDIRALHEMLEAQLHEPPARPKRIIVIDALPLTAVGKLFKPALREHAILEKLRLEIAQHCGPAAVFEAEVGTDAQGRTAVSATVTVTGTETDAGAGEDACTDASAQQAEALRAALAPLPQSYALTVEAPRVQLQIEDGIATLTLDHPQSLNAASRAMMRGLEVRLRQLAALPDLRAVIITGAGRAFCAGGDLIEFTAARDAGGSALIDTLAHNQQVISLIEELPVPVIGVVNGIVPAGGASLRLPERIGAARAAQLFYTAELISAQTALAWGLVCEVVAPEGLMERARAKAAHIAANSPEGSAR